MVSKEAAQAIGKARIAIAKALKFLKEEKVIQDVAIQGLARYAHMNKHKPLVTNELKRIEGWIPIQQAESQAQESFKNATASLMNVIKKAVLDYQELLPILPSVSDFDVALRDAGAESTKGPFKR